MSMRATHIAIELIKEHHTIAINSIPLLYFDVDSLENDRLPMKTRIGSVKCYFNE